MGLSLHPSYASLVAHLLSSPPTTKFLDLGTCLGQDLRKLNFDGVSPDILYGSDVFPQYERVGHDLFRDESAFRDHFLPADIFDDAADGPLVRTQGTWDVVSIVMFLHIWDWDTQVRACKRIVKLLSRKVGSLVIGAQTGSTEPGEQALKPPFVAEGEKRSVYRQSAETFEKMWRIIEEEEGLKLKIHVEYEEREAREARVHEEKTEEKKKFFKGSEQRRLFFTIEIL